MKVFVNNKEIKILNGMSVKHAVIAAGLYEEIKRGKRTYDEWGNEIGLDGALSEDMKIYVK
jgi:hypothetical protein